MPVTRHTIIHEQITRLFHAFRRGFSRTNGSHVWYYPARWRRSITTRWMLTILVIVKLPASPAVENADHGRDVLQFFHWSAFVYPRDDLSYAGNFLICMFSTPCEPYEVNPILERAMDHILIPAR